MNAVVVYDSEIRNARNIKYKPGAGKIESAKWNMMAVFPNFCFYNKSIKMLLLSIIGKIVKAICEEGNVDSWCMKYTKDFVLRLTLDGELVQELPIAYTSQG